MSATLVHSTVKQQGPDPALGTSNGNCPAQRVLIPKHAKTSPPPPTQADGGLGRGLRDAQ